MSNKYVEVSRDVYIDVPILFEESQVIEDRYWLLPKLQEEHNQQQMMEEYCE